MRTIRKVALALFASTAFALAAFGAAAEPIKITRITHIYGVVADPSDPAKLYLATERGYYVAGPNGNADLLSTDEAPVMGFAPSPKAGGAIYSTGGEHQGLRVSIDNGKTWIGIGRPNATTPGPFLTVDISPVNVKNLFATAGMEFFRSVDGGVTWQSQGMMPATPVDVAASGTDANTVYLATVKGLFVSRDGGKTWGPAVEGDKAATMVATSGDGTTYAFLAGAGLMKTADGVKWDALVPATAFDGALLHLAVSPATGELYVVTQFMKIVASTDGGKTWAPFTH